MNLTINNYQVDFELEGEKNLSDIIKSIVDWAKERQLIFTEVQLDDKLYLIDKIPDANVDEIDKINCLVHSKADVIFASISEANSYCDRAFVFIKESLEKEGTISKQQLHDFIHGLDWLIEVLLKVVDLIDIKIETLQFKDKSIASFIDQIIDLKKTISALADEKEIAKTLDKNKDLLVSIKNIFKILIGSEEMKKMIVHNIESPDIIIRALAEINAEFPEQLNNIEDIAVAFQAGKDGEGSEKLNAFIEFIYRYIKVCYQIIPLFSINLSEIEINGTSLEEKNGIIQDLLREATEIFENNDIISLSDILEYELKPAMEDLPAYVDVLLEKINNQ